MLYTRDWKSWACCRNARIAFRSFDRMFTLHGLILRYKCDTIGAKWVLPIQFQSIMHAKVKNEFFAIIHIMFCVHFRIQRVDDQQIDSTKCKMESQLHELTHFNRKTSGLFTRISNGNEKWMFRIFSLGNGKIFSLNMITRWANETGKFVINLNHVGNYDN